MHAPVHRRTCIQHTCICTHTRSHAPSITEQIFCCFLYEKKKKKKKRKRREKKRKMNGVEINTRAYVATRLLLQGGVVYWCTAKKKGGGSTRFHHSARCASKWRRPNLREAGRTTGNPMLCYAGERLGVAFCVFWGVRVASGAQWHQWQHRLLIKSNINQIRLFDKRNKLNLDLVKFSQKHQTPFFWPRIEHSVAVTYMIQSNFFRMHSSIPR